MNIPCHNPCQTCTPFVGGASSPSDPDYPFVNLSSESPDVDVFIGRRNVSPPGGGPPLGGFFYAIGCLGFCVSPVSQEEADLCALRQEMDCLSINWPEFPPNPGVPLPPDSPNNPPPGPPNPRPLYNNVAQSCNFTCPDGQLFTFTVPAGTFTAFSQAAADASAHSYACNQAVAQRLCVSDFSPVLTCLGAEFNGSLVASTINVPVSFTITGDIPDGLSMVPSGNYMFLLGTATLAGDYAFTVTITDSQGHTVDRLVALVVFGITNNNILTNATSGTPYSATLTTAGTVTTPVTYSITAGALPSGLALSSTTGEISGTPTVDGEFSFTVKATSSDIACSKQFVLTVEEVSSCPDWSQLLWQAPSIVDFPPQATASFTPDSVQSDTGEGHAAADDGFPAAATNNATVAYNGSGCDCVVNVDWLSTLSPSSTASIAINSALFGLLKNESTNSLGNGAHAIPFSLPDTGGVNDTITVQVSAFKSFLDVGAGTVDVTATFSNV